MATPPRPQTFIGRNYLRLISILFAMGSLGLLSSVLFNVHLYPKFITDWYHFMDFRQGIPVEAMANLTVDDSSITNYNKDGDSIVSVQPRSLDLTKSTQSVPTTGDESGSIFIDKKLLTRKGAVIKHITVNKMHIRRAELYLQTKNIWYRLYFGFPAIITLIAASCCFWLLAGLVSDIQKGKSFGKASWKRLQFIGWAVLTVQIIYLVMDLFAPLLGRFFVSVTNTIAGNQSHFDFRADPVLSFNPAWALIGVLVLTLASAFRDGEILQEDKNSIV